MSERPTIAEAEDKLSIEGPSFADLHARRNEARRELSLNQRVAMFAGGAVIVGLGIVAGIKGFNREVNHQRLQGVADTATMQQHWVKPLESELNADGIVLPPHGPENPNN